MSQEKILEKIQKVYPERKDFEICKAGFNTKKRKTSFRVNTLKSSKQEIEEILQKHNLEFSKVDFLDNGYILENGKEKNLWDLEIFTQGKIYLQSVSSQLPVQICGVQENMNILDITAAPGGKTSQLAAKMNNSGKIVAIDNNAIRIDKLNFTLKRQGISNTKVIKTDARQLAENNPDFREYFDIILADLPCSAEGKINFNKEKSFAYWDETVPKKNAKLQKAILKNTVSLLKTGGSLVYSTCAISPEENEDIIHFLLCNFPELSLEKVEIDSEYSRSGLATFGKKHFKKEIVKNTLRILPSEETEGFFIAKLRKK